MRLRAFGAGLAIAAVAVVAVAASGYIVPRSGGPFGGLNRAGVIYQAAVGEPISWAMPLPDNPTTTEVVIDSIAPVGVDGLDVLGVLVSPDGCEGVPTLAKAFPPPGVSTVAPQGVILGALSKPCALHVLIGVHRSKESANGTIAGIRIRYHAGWVSYEDLLPWALEIKDPGA